MSRLNYISWRMDLSVITSEMMRVAVLCLALALIIYFATGYFIVDLV